MLYAQSVRKGLCLHHRGRWGGEAAGGVQAAEEGAAAFVIVGLEEEL